MVSIIALTAAKAVQKSMQPMLEAATMYNASATTIAQRNNNKPLMI
jgi:hypothetical protein